MCDNYNISCSEKSVKILWNSNSDSNLSPGFLDEGKKEWQHIICIDFNQISAVILIITEYILIELAHICMVSRNLGTSILLYHCWTWILMGVKVEWNSNFQLVFKSVSIISVVH